MNHFSTRCFFKRKKCPGLKRSRLLSAVFEQYQKSRVQFVQTVATLSTRPQNAEILQSVGKEPFRVPLLASVLGSCLLSCSATSCRCDVIAATPDARRGAQHPADSCSGPGPPGGAQRCPGGGCGDRGHPARTDPIPGPAERQCI